MLGNSVADNFVPTNIEKILQWGKTLKLTVDGGFPSEISFMLEKALLYGKIKHVLWVIRPDNFTPDLKERWNSEQKIPFYLYNDSVFDDWPYLYSIDMFNISISLANGSVDSKKWGADLDVLNYWQSDRHILKQINYNKAKNLEKLAKQLDGKKIERIKCDSDKYYPLAVIIFNFVHKNPDINFYFIIAPETYHSLKIRSPKKLTEYYCFQKFFVLEAKYYKNMSVFGFENDIKIVGNIANYRDAIHYHSGVNNYMLQKMALGDNMLNLKNIDDYIQSVIHNLNEYSLYSSFESMIPFAKNEENQILQNIFSVQQLSDLLEEAREQFRHRNYNQTIQLTSDLINNHLSNSYLSAKSYALRAAALYRLGSLKPSLQDYNRAIDLQLEHAAVYVDRGLVRQRIKDEKGAEADFLEAIALKPDYYRGYWFLGKLRFAKGLHEEGIALLTRAIELNSGRSSLYSDRGRMYQALNKNELALKDFEKFKELKDS